MSLCLCDCGNETKNNNKYMWGHNLRSKDIEDKRVIGLKKFWNNEEKRIRAKERMSILWKDEKYIIKQKEGMNKSEVKVKMKKAAVERMANPEIKNKMIRTMKEKFSNYDFRMFISKRTKEGMLEKGYTSEVISRLTKEGMKDLDLSGPNSASWLGGSPYKGYCPSWRGDEFREYIFERDNKECQNPYCWHTSERLTRHHIDYDKKNCSPKNVITLCNSCNARANKNRNYWRRLYKRIIKMKFQENDV